ncbi:MAG: DUF1700 domain-containing protein [Sporolactobacillus sp.]
MRNEFLQELNTLLHHIPVHDRQEILTDYEEHFVSGLSEGKTEAEIAAELGDPKVIAEAIQADYFADKKPLRQPAINLTRCILAGTVLLFFNLIIVFGPFIAIVSTYFSIWAIVITFVVSPLLAFALLQAGWSSFFFIFFCSLILLGIGILLSIALIIIGKLLWKLFLIYARFNLEVVTGRKAS